MKSMILCTGIKGVGVYDGEIIIRFAPKEWYSKIPVDVAKHGDVIAIKHGDYVYVSSYFFKPYSYTLGHESGDSIKSLARCLCKLGLYSKDALEKRFAELAQEYRLKSHMKSIDEFNDMCGNFGIRPTIKQLQAIGRVVRNIKK